MGEVIKKATYVQGVQYWAQWYTKGYDVYRVVAHNPDKGVWFFAQYKNSKFIVPKSYYQLNRNGFFPFVLETRFITAGAA